MLNNPPAHSCVFSTFSGSFDLSSLHILTYRQPVSNWIFAFSPCFPISPLTVSQLCASCAITPAVQVTLGECFQLAAPGSCRIGNATFAQAVGISLFCIGGESGRRSSLLVECSDGPNTIDSVVESGQLYTMKVRGHAGCALECGVDLVTKTIFYTHT